MAVVGVDTLLCVSYYYIILYLCSPSTLLYCIRNSTIIIYALLPCAKLSRKDPETKTSKKKKKKKLDMCCCCGEDCKCRPLGFLLGLPFAFVCLLLSIIGVVIWIVGLLLTCICPCCLCVTLIVEFALVLIKAPFAVMEWFTTKIPC